MYCRYINMYLQLLEWFHLDMRHSFLRRTCINVIQLMEWFYLTMPHNFYANQAHKYEILKKRSHITKFSQIF